MFPFDEQRTVFHLDGVTPYRAETIIDGVLCYKYGRGTTWTPYTPQELTQRIGRLEYSNKELRAANEALYAARKS